MKRLLKILLLIVGLAAFGYASIIVYAIWDFRERQVTLRVQTQQPLTEEQAVALSREALHLLGEDVTKFTPRAYNGTNFYARNTISPSSGYVMWASTGSPPSFSVQLDQTSGVVRCGVSRCK